MNRRIKIPTVNPEVVKLLEETLVEAKEGKVQTLGMVIGLLNGEFSARGTGRDRFEDAGRLLYLAVSVCNMKDQAPDA